MANVGTATAGKVLTATGQTSSSAFQLIGTNSGLTDNGVLIGGGLGPFTATAALTNGQVVIGSTGVDPVAASLTAGTGITITPGAGTITIANTGAIVDLHGPRFIVGNTSNGANYSTIAAAIAAATSGDTIFIQDGTYTENLTHKAGITLSALGGDELTPSVTIIGKNTYTLAGTLSFYGIRLTTNSDFFLVVSGNSAAIVNLENCYLNCLNNTGISHTNAGASIIHCRYCTGDIGTTGISLFASSSAGNIQLYYCIITDLGSSTTASTMSAGTFYAWYCNLKFAVTTSGTTASIQFIDTFIQAPGNTTSITHNSTNASGATVDGGFVSGATASAVSIGAGANLFMRGTSVSSSNTNAITGSGTLNYTDLHFVGNSSVMNVTTQTAFYTNLGKFKASGQPAFSAYLASSATDVTGDGTAYQLGTAALTEFYDIGSNFNTNGTFTAPVAGIYHFDYGVLAQSGVATMTATLVLAAAGVSFNYGNYGTIGTGNWPMSDSRDVQMAAGDTATVTVTFGNGTKTVDIYGAGSDPRTFFSGRLVC